tara:strand:- start:143 stop:451 length:309 start_codon:yes stop_codon:yes gene_type:complete
MTDLSEAQIALVLERYKKKRDMERTRYHLQKESNPDFLMQNRERAKKYYEKNKEKKKEYYQKNAEWRKAKTLKNYYERAGRIEEFKTKYPDRATMLGLSNGA